MTNPPAWSSLRSTSLYRFRGVLLSATVLVLMVLWVHGAAAQQADGEVEVVEVEVRVAAQRLPDGRTEFALQEREAAGSWAERRLPRARFFPANARIDRWLSSSPLVIEFSPDSMLAENEAPGNIEVRVAARLLADGRMEFALQEREADGSWAERRLPRARFFPANAPLGRWLSSSPLVVTVTIATLTSDAAAAASDRAVLVALYNATGGPNWHYNTNWLSDRPIGEWDGVITDGSGRVTELSLPENQLSGPIPAELGKLANLQELTLAENQLSGRIPSELGNLANLRRLWLSSNQLSGRIPSELGNLANLLELSLYENQLSGRIPSELGNLANLLEMWLFDNRLSGPLPDSFTGLDALRSLHWHDTELCAPGDAAFQAWLRGVRDTNGENCAAAASPDRAALVALYNATNGPSWTDNTNWLSDEPIGEWHGVWTNEDGRVIGIDLQGNQLSGVLPAELGQLARLETLALSGEGLRGSIPAELGRLARLRALYLYDSQLSGPIPSELGRLTNLWRLYLVNNQLSGEIPSELGRLTNLELLELEYNRLSGEIPAGLGNLANLEQLKLAANQLSGPIPPELGNLANLEQLLLFNNRLSGPLPHTFIGLHALETLHWYGTELCAPTDLPFQAWLSVVADTIGDDCATASQDRAALVALYNATNGPRWTNNINWLSDEPIGAWFGVTTNEDGRVTELSLPDNQLSGRIPSELGNLANLQELVLFDNQLSGRIPSELGRLRSLRGLLLAGNQLSGRIPPELGNLASLEALWLHGNQLSGRIPPELGRLRNLQGLLLYRNDLSGDIPPELGNLANLEQLLLFNNRLSGPFPDSFTDLDALGTLHWYGTELCAPTDAAFQAWLRGVANRSGENCAAPVSPDRAALVALYNATGGPNWTNNTNWLSDEPIGEWFGVTTNDEGRVTELRLAFNALVGTIPSELGDLAILERLWLHQNELSGTIPSELGSLANLKWLTLGDSRLTGPFPDSFTDLDALQQLDWVRTKLCAPTDAAFQSWLSGLLVTNGENCAEPVSNDYDNDDDGLIEVANLAQLNAIRWDLDGDGTPSSNTAGYNAAFPNAAAGMGCAAGGCTGYELAENLDFDTNGNGQPDSGDDYWNGGEGWDPIGSTNDNFSASFDGGGRTISNLHIDREASYLGLFGTAATGSEIKNIGLLKALVTGTGDGRGSHVGGLVGLNRGAIDNSYTSGGTISGISILGGLVGDNFGSVTKSRSSASVTGQRSYTGGLVGRMCGPIANSYATGNVNGNSHVGGLAGGSLLCEPGRSPITASYATGKVTGDSRVGGLVGSSKDPITDSYATGAVTGDTEVGGLVGGTTASSTTITTSYSTGKVTGNSDAGGLLGYNFTSGTRAMSGYWDTETSGQSSSAVGEGKTTSELQSPTSNTGIYSTWDPDVWDFGTSSQYPRLKIAGPR